MAAPRERGRALARSARHGGSPRRTTRGGARLQAEKAAGGVEKGEATARWEAITVGGDGRTEEEARGIGAVSGAEGWGSGSSDFGGDGEYCSYVQ
jgi:hypothetical protein